MMMRRLGVTAVAVAMVMVSMTALATARTINAKTSLPMSLDSTVDPTGTPVGSLRGDTVVPAQRYCEQRRKIEIFRDGKKIGSAESDRYGGWSFSLNPVEPGRYVAKTKRMLLPITPNDNKVYCGAAQSKPVIVP